MKGKHGVMKVKKKRVHIFGGKGVGRRNKMEMVHECMERNEWMDG